jgi:ubiquinone/menaquinone biosynthesis C-methylase UbiE
MGIGSWLFASVYDRMTAGVEAAGLAEERAHLLAQARGRVLEIGAGTGANLRHYPGEVRLLVCTEPEAAMVRRLTRRRREGRLTPAVVRATSERLPFADGAFDTVVSTLVLCTVGSQARSLAEIARVLAPGGQLLFLEHVRADDPALARWQDRLNRLNRFVAGGCNCNRATLEALSDAGFAIDSLTRGTLPKAPPIVRPMIVGAARRRPETGERRH